MSDLVITSTQETWLWIGTAGMALGAILILALGRGLGKHSHHAVTSFFVCAVAACFYLLMAQGQGDVIITAKDVALTPEGLAVDAESRLVYFARYLDWVVTTPLLLIGLLGVGLAAVKSAGEDVRQRTGLVAGVIGADILMIVTGLFGALSLDSTHKYVWFIVSCVFFLAVLFVVWGPIRTSAKAQGGGIAALYDKLLFILTGLWFVYPVLWLTSPAQFASRSTWSRSSTGFTSSNASWFRTSVVSRSRSRSPVSSAGRSRTCVMSGVFPRYPSHWKSRLARAKSPSWQTWSRM